MKFWDWMPFLLSWMLRFKPAFSPSSRGSLVPPHFLPLEWYHLHIAGGWYFSWQFWFQLMIHPVMFHISSGSFVQVYDNKIILLLYFWKFYFTFTYIYTGRQGGFQYGSGVKNPPAMQETRVQFLDWEDALEKEMTTHSSRLAWKIPWTMEPGRSQSKRMQKNLDVAKQKQQIYMGMFLIYSLF